MQQDERRFTREIWAFFFSLRESLIFPSWLAAELKIHLALFFRTSKTSFGSLLCIYYDSERASFSFLFLFLFEF